MLKRVLVVDDDPVQRRIIEESLRRSGYEFRSAHSGEQALSLLEGAEANTISIVLLDLVMPGMDGMAVLERIKRHRRRAPRHRADRARLHRCGDQRDARGRRRLRDQAGGP